MALDIGARAGRQLVRLPRGRLGPERARVRRPRDRRRLPEAQLPVRDHRERRRQALRGRGRRLPQPHLRQVRPGGPAAAQAVRVAGVRRQGAAPAARRVPHQAGHQGDRRHASRSSRASSTASTRTASSTPSKRYNEAVQAEIPFNPNVKDGTEHRRHHPAQVELGERARHAAVRGLPVTCGITFTFGGLAIDPRTAHVLDGQKATPIPGLYACGELVGGLFYFNYPGGSGLTAGAVFGRIAGVHAATAPPGRRPEWRSPRQAARGPSSASG